MCGIVGYTGKHKAKDILLEGLKRLEYRGYDSAGLSLADASGQLNTIRSVGRVEALVADTQGVESDSCLGIGHTRWATHGTVSQENTHPHCSSDGKFALAHNGVIENYISLKAFLEGKGFSFSSQTDSEVIVNLIAYYYEQFKDDASGSFLKSVQKSSFHLEGTYGIAVICSDFPGELIGASKGSPLVLGVGEGEHILASDVTALVPRTRNVVYLKEGEVVHITPDNFSISTMENNTIDAVIERVHWEVKEAEIGKYSHFMEKEIFEQPIALENAMRGRFSNDSSTAKFGGLNLSPQEWRHVDRIVFCGCGTAWHACLITEYLIERFARIPVEVEYASEFRYRNAPLDKNTLFIAISQSGETIDTLAALREAKRKGFQTLAITNVVGSTIAREAGAGIYQHAGPEIGVASTKAFTSQVLLGGMLALYLARLRDMSFADGRRIVQALKQLPEQVESIIQQADSIKNIAKKYVDYEHMLFLGRQNMFPVALEGALKLKEISYIHAEGYPAAEMKHGPIALISEKCPSLFLAVQGEIYEKTLANIQEIKARKGLVIAVVSENAPFPKELADDLIIIPDAHEISQPILATIPLQLLSYYIAVERNCDVDKPRNLAKSVTVE